MNGIHNFLYMFLRYQNEAEGKTLREAATYGGVR